MFVSAYTNPTRFSQSYVIQNVIVDSTVCSAKGLSIDVGTLAI